MQIRKCQAPLDFLVFSIFVFNVEALELPRFLPFRSFCAVFRALPSRRTLGSNEIPDLALVVSVPTVCFKNERYTSTHSLCSSLQRCKKWRMKKKKKRKNLLFYHPQLCCYVTDWIHFPDLLSAQTFHSCCSGSLLAV